MQLRSTDGAIVALSPDGYQFPYDGPPTAGRDTDANWLTIKGTVTRATGERYKFRDPCLLTLEAFELGDWLKAAALGRIEPTDRPDEDAGLCVFLEPNLAFSVSAWDDGSVTIRVHLSAEASPPWAHPGTELFDTFLPLHLSTTDLAQAGSEWLAEMAAYPLR